jgi:spore coat polysaccharide biosynthesis protein SpsF
MLGTLAVVQARMGSSRLPGKSLRPLIGRTVLGVLLERLKQARKLNGIVVATSDCAVDNPIVGLAARYGLQSVRGSEADVLDRFQHAVFEVPAQTIVRICADNPLTDPEQVDTLVEYFEKGGYDYAYSNRPECGLPCGVGAEVISASALRLVHQKATSAQHREHVTLYVLDNPAMFKIGALMAPPALWYPEFRLDVDHEEDLAFLERIYALLRQTPEANWTTREIVELLLAKPELLTRRAEANSTRLVAR